jgi:hypothetical protein
MKIETKIGGLILENVLFLNHSPGFLEKFWARGFAKFSWILDQFEEGL